MNPLLPLEVPIQIGGAEARRRALAELAKAKYGSSATNPQLQWLLDQIERWLRALSVIVPAPSDRGGTNWGFLAVVLILLVLIGVVVWRVGLPRWRRRVRDAEVAVDAVRTATDYRASAEQSAQAGDWGAAVRDRYRAVVRDLETATVVDARPGRTAFEVAAVAGRLLPAVREDLYAAAGSFGAVSYSDVVARAGDYEAMVGYDRAIAGAVAGADLARIDEPEKQPVGGRR